MCVTDQFVKLLLGTYLHASLYLSVFMGWLPIIHLVHMGAELCELNPTPRSFLSCRFHTHVIHTKTLPRILDFRSSMLCWEHVVDLNRRSVTAHLKNTVRLCRWQSVSEPVYFWTAALEEAENAAGLSVFMRRRAAPKCMAAAAYWDRHSAHNLCCYQMSWEEGSEWGLLIH